MNKYEALKTYYGHDSFREGQESIIDSLLSGRDVMCIMPTGAGKSICYQIPALLSEGITLVISPLISLMKDQVGALKQMGVGAAYLNSSLTFRQYLLALERAREGRYKIIYVAPERLANEEFQSFCRDVKVSLVAVDEAHCVSQWGNDFRPSYRRIAGFVNSLPERPPIGAFTATATKVVGEDVLNLLELRDPYRLTTGFDRKNLRFEVIHSVNKDADMLSYIAANRDKSGIVYCSTRKNVEAVCDILCENGFPATRYHAGLEEEERRINQEDFIYDRKPLMVATNAFGMGIDKSNVSYVLHYNMPMSLENYYQEAGRAGRDGSEAECVLLYSPADVRLNRFLLERSEPDPEIDEYQREILRQRDEERLKKMTFYATTSDCLRGFILNYFGESMSSHTDIGSVMCGNCSNCSREFETVDVTETAKHIIRCVDDTDCRFGVKMICDILRGIETDRIESMHLYETADFASLASKSETELRQVIDCLKREGLLAVSEGDYPTLCLTALSNHIYGGKLSVMMKRPIIEEKPKKSGAASKSAYSKKPRKKSGVNAEADYDTVLYEKLRELRKKLADKASVPAYVVFTDATLREMALKKPLTQIQFLDISGIGTMKAERYAKDFLALINEYVNK